MCLLHAKACTTSSPDHMPQGPTGETDTQQEVRLVGMRMEDRVGCLDWLAGRGACDAGGFKPKANMSDRRPTIVGGHWDPPGSQTSH